MVIANPVAGFCVENILGQLIAGETAAQGCVSGSGIGAAREHGNVADTGMIFFTRLLNC